ncbi:MAG: site-2 protease family protein [Elusimicrobia bacterium]|nr:site-2 protease family protein [Elusimicrobiota bacterium]
MDLSLLIELPLLFFSIICHEYSHGAVAEKFGDDTARVMGRLTFNPLPHIDPMGTIFLPLMCFLTNAPLFGWAKPVPVNPSRLDRQPLSLFLVSAIGPMTNLFLAAAAALGLAVTVRWLPAPWQDPLLIRVFNYTIIINLYLTVFNLMPIPPLDGSKVLEVVLPPLWRQQYERLAPHGFLIILLLMMTGIFGRIVTPIVYLLYRLLV